MATHSSKLPESTDSGSLPLPLRDILPLLQVDPVSLTEEQLTTVITGFAPLQEAQPDEISFFANPRYRKALEETQAAAVLVNREDQLPAPVHGSFFIAVESPSLSFAKLVEHFFRPAVDLPTGIHPSASIDPSAKLGEGVSVGPQAVVEAGAHIGARTILHAGVVIGRESHLGEDCHIYPNVSLRERVLVGNRVILHSGVVLGSDGFGFEFRNGRHEKIAQVGIVQVDDDVEIGANSTVDRARFGRTWIKEGSKVDNLVQIAHNVVVGKHCIIVAGTMIAGSVILEDYVVLGGQVGVAGHLRIGQGAQLAARTGVSKDLDGGQTYWGTPAAPIAEAKRKLAHINMLGRLFHRVKVLEQSAESKQN